METMLPLCVGVALSAACGFRVFVPLLVLSLAALSGHAHLAPGFEWIGSWTAFLAFAVATSLEVAGYYLPWVDNFLDSLAVPAAIIAGTLTTATQISDMSPFLKWSLAIIAGGGVAGVVQGTTTLLRGLSTVSTGGLGNPMLATVELGGSVVMSLMALLLPLLAGVLVIGMLVFIAKRFLKKQPRSPGA